MLKRLPALKAPLALMIAAFLSFALFLPGSIANSQNTIGPVKTESVFKAKCAVCHGADGAGTALGKRMQAPDLRSKEVRDQPSAALARIISQGKENMPPFGATLDSKQIDSLVEYIRRLRVRASADAR